MKKIIFDARELEKNKYTGIGRFVLNILKNKNYFNGFDFVLICDSKTDLDNPTLKDFKKYLIKDSLPIISEQFYVRKIIKETKADIYFSPYYKYPVFCDIPVITSIFDIIYLKLEPYKKNLKNKIYLKNFIRFFTAKADAIITSSYSTKKDMVSFFNMDEKKIKVIRLSIDESIRKMDKTESYEILKKMNINFKYILYVGNNNPHKNIKTLYDAYLNLPFKLRSEYKLVLVGFKDSFKDYPNAFVIPQADDTELSCLYSNSSLFVFPSLYEGFGYPPLEALKCGLKVLVSDIPVFREVLGDNADYFDPADILKLSKKIEEVLMAEVEKKTFDISNYQISNFLKDVSDVLNGL